MPRHFWMCLCRHSILKLLCLPLWTFSHVTLDNTLAAFRQYVDCVTRATRMIGLFYAKRKEFFKSHSHACAGGKQTTICFC